MNWPACSRKQMCSLPYSSSPCTEVPLPCRSTNYKKWFSSPEPYPIRFKSGYEPYVLVARKIMPWYDERFRGYGWDKVGFTNAPGGHNAA